MNAMDRRHWHPLAFEVGGLPGIDLLFDRLAAGAYQGYEDREKKRVADAASCHSEKFR